MITHERSARVPFGPMLLIAVFAFVAGRWSGPASEMAIDARADVPTPRAAAQGVQHLHDATYGVTCWYVPDGGLACLPDRALAPWLDQP